MQLPFLFFDIGSGELFVVLLLVLIFFGPKQIPSIARSIGKGLYELRRASDQIKREVMEEAEKAKSQVRIEDDSAPSSVNNPGETHEGEKTSPPPAG
ncbi:MAG: twin-arginine translocase TatA/TatE family subunit [Bacteroidales bacterium]|jgi:sec-independent protein translocase protein TatA|nr:twin-arginine translocase TatA/TatE family subunit [Bacteroidales bacterium]